MCQYKDNCKNFIPNKRNNTNCRVLCTRNPLLDYELPNEFEPVRALSKAEANLEFEMSPAKVIKEGDNFDIANIKDEIAKIQEDQKIPNGIKRDRVQEILIKRGILESTQGEELDTTNLPETRNVSLQEALTETNKRKEQTSEVAEVVEDNLMESQDVTGWKAPRRRGKGNR